ncbi:phosphonate C-P lyase system protein PhnH [Alsobacter sp. R-9]
MTDLQATASGGTAIPDSVRTAQAVFRSVMMALAQPGSLRTLHAPIQGPGRLSRGAAAIALALCDFETPVWLDETLAADEAVASYLRFYTGCPFVADRADAHFAFVNDGRVLPTLDGFAQGTLEYPDRSTTVVVPVERLSVDEGWRLTGPGIAGEARLRAEPLPDDLPAQLDGNRARFPRGVDLLFVCGDRVAALPRTTIVTV